MSVRAERITLNLGYAQESYKMIFRLSDASRQLPLPANAKWPQGVWDLEIFRKNDVSVSLFAPKEQDYQTPHEQDEIYVIQSGHGVIVIENQAHKFMPGDVIYVAAGKEHRFTEFSDDLAAWVVFFGDKAPAIK